jgi:hypothetical protein
VPIDKPYEPAAGAGAFDFTRCRQRGWTSTPFAAGNLPTTDQNGFGFAQLHPGGAVGLYPMVRSFAGLNMARVKKTMNTKIIIGGARLGVRLTF